MLAVAQFTELKSKRNCRKNWPQHNLGQSPEFYMGGLWKSTKILGQ